MIPALNEAANLPRVISTLRAACPSWDILVIDDGSTDQTSAVARSLGVEVVQLPFNLGIGGAVQTGFIYGYRGGYDVCVQVDGDAQHDAAETLRLVDALVDGGADAVVGSRFLSETADNFRSSFGRRIGIRLLRWVISGLCHQPVSDPTSGHRAFGRRAIELLAHDYPQEYPEPEVLHMLLHRGYKVVELPVRMHARAHGISSIRLLDSVLYMVKVLVAIFIRATTPREVQTR